MKFCMQLGATTKQKIPFFSRENNKKPPNYLIIAKHFNNGYLFLVVSLRIILTKNNLITFIISFYNNKYYSF